MAKAEIHVFFIDSLKLYVDSMQKSLSEIDQYFGHDELQELHARAESESIAKVEDQKFSVKQTVQSIFLIVRRAAKTWW